MRKAQHGDKGDKDVVSNNNHDSSGQDGSFFQKAMRLHELVESHFYDDNGLFYSSLDSHTFCRIPSELADLYPLKNFEGKPANTDWIAYENTGMASGSYLSALCARKKSEDGNVGIDKMIARVFDCIRKVHNMSVAVKGKGFFCKPYGGRPSSETTLDQYSPVITGLSELSFINHPLSEEARNIAIKLASWWMKNDYNCNVWGREGKAVENLPWSFTCMAFIRIAYALSGDKKFDIESQRLCREYLSDKPVPRSGAYIKKFWKDKPQLGIRRMAAFHHTVVDGLSAMFDAWPERKELWAALLENFWRKDVNMGVADDGLAYACYQVDEETNKWEVLSPGFMFPPDISPDKYPFPHHFWLGGFKSGSLSCMIASSAVSTGMLIPRLADECRELAMRILSSVDENKMTFVIDDKGNQECPTFGEVRKRMFDGRCPGQWLRAYWQGRRRGWWN